MISFKSISSLVRIENDKWIGLMDRDNHRLISGILPMKTSLAALVPHTTPPANRQITNSLSNNNLIHIHTLHLLHQTSAHRILPVIILQYRALLAPTASLIILQHHLISPLIHIILHIRNEVLPSTTMLEIQLLQNDLQITHNQS